MDGGKFLSSKYKARWGVTLTYKSVTEKKVHSSLEAVSNATDDFTQNKLISICIGYIPCYRRNCRLFV